MTDKIKSKIFFNMNNNFISDNNGMISLKVFLEYDKYI